VEHCISTPTGGVIGVTTLTIIAIVLQLPGCWLACLELHDRRRAGRRQRRRHRLDIELHIRLRIKRR
jgi:hypothetical protein